MPLAYVALEEPAKENIGLKAKRRLVRLMFPTRNKNGARDPHSKWVWPDLSVKKSGIQGFGLFTNDGGDVDWKNLHHHSPIVMPYLGYETEVESAALAKVFRYILSGSFELVPAGTARTQHGHVWVQDGVYVNLIREDNYEPSEDMPLVDVNSVDLIQVSLQYDNVSEGDEEVVYLLVEDVKRLLHLPSHIFELLAGHSKGQHADRHMCTHVIGFKRRTEHLLVNAHPIFRNTAFIMGNVNEPLHKKQNLDIIHSTFCLLDNRDPLLQRSGLRQPEGIRDQYKLFLEDYPELAEKSGFFMTRSRSYEIGEELTVDYGNGYHRSYSVWGRDAGETSYYIPDDIYEDGIWECADRGSPWAKWPANTPGWFNVKAQPSNRPAFEEVFEPHSYHIRLLPDLQPIVAARQRFIDGGVSDPLAKAETLCADWTLRPLSVKDFEPPMNLNLATALDFIPKCSFSPFIGSSWPLLSNANELKGIGHLGDVSDVADYTNTSAEALATQIPISFELSNELKNLTRHELAEMAAAEDGEIRRNEYDNDDDSDDPDWNSPWIFPLGSIVWCKMQAFPWWPAQLQNPAVDDHDVALLRGEHHVFVCFLGWKQNASHVWAHTNDIVPWQEGIKEGYDRISVKKKHEASFRKAVATANKLVEGKMKVPPGPPPWWNLMHTFGRKFRVNTHHVNSMNGSILSTVENSGARGRTMEGTHQRIEVGSTELVSLAKYSNKNEVENDLGKWSEWLAEIVRWGGFNQSEESSTIEFCPSSDGGGSYDEEANIISTSHSTSGSPCTEILPSHTINCNERHLMRVDTSETSTHMRKKGQGKRSPANLSSSFAARKKRLTRG